jgi:transcriptional regulator with XRE-family HTH domain
MSIQQFADELGVSRSLLSIWMAGKNKPSETNIEKIALVLGFEVYDALDLPRPDPDLQIITRLWPALNEDARQKLLEQAERFVIENEKHNSTIRPSESTP